MKTTFPFTPISRRNPNRFLLVALFLFHTIFGFSQLSGTYTIGESQDYSDVESAIVDLHTNGISGPVIFDIIPGTYEVHVTMNQIAGGSETNTITFQSSTQDSSDVILQYEATSYDDNWIFLLDGPDYLNFNHLTFKAKGESIYGTIFKFDGYSSNICFNNNAFYGKYSTSATARQTIIRVDAENSNNQHFSNIHFLNNYFNKGSYAIFLEGPNNDYIFGSIVEGNVFEETGYCCVYCNFNSAPVITRNDMEAVSYGIRVNGDHGGGTYSYNKIYSEYQGMNIQRIGPVVNRALISNNCVTIGSNGTKGISIANSVYTDVLYNSVYVLSNSWSASAFYSAGAVNQVPTVTVKNNNFSCEYSSYVIEVITENVISEMSNNNLYTAGNYIASWNYERLFDIKELQDLSGMNENSLSVYPHYLSERDLHCIAPWLDGKGEVHTLVTDDIDGESRGASPDIGADQFEPDPASTTPLDGSGEYTIGSGGTYADFETAMADVLLRGVSAPVTFGFLEGTYDDQFVVKRIPGTGDDKRVTIQSAGTNDNYAHLTYSANSNDDNYVFKFHGADFITLKNLKLTAKGTQYSRVIDLYQGADSIIIENDSLIATRNTNAQANMTILFSKDSDFRSRIIRQNQIIDGAYAIYMRRDQNNFLYPTGAEIVENHFSNTGYSAMYLQFYESPQIIGNTIESNMNGIQALSCSHDLRIQKNKIDMAGGDGIYLSTCMGNEDHKGLISNNFIHCGGTSKGFGIYVNSSPWQLIFNNSVNITSSHASSEALYIASGGTTSAMVYNNIFANTGGGSAIYIYNPSTVVGSDYNNYYSMHDYLVYWGEDVTNLESLRLLNSMDEHSVFGNPHFISDTDLHTSAAILDSAAASFAVVPDDIDDDIRSVEFPDIGADEFNFVPNNPPVALDDSLSTATEITIHPLLNDYDTDNDNLIITEISTPNQGTASILAGDTTILYTPVNYSPQFDTIQYMIRDDHGAVDTAYIYITLYREMEGFVKMDFELDSISHGSAKFGDIDNDGDLDILQTGWQGDNQEYVSQIYTYNNEIYTKRNPGLTGLSSGTPEGAAMIDFDNDEELELLITGIVENTESTLSTMFYDNQYPSFPEITDFQLRDVTSGSADWGDFNRDGKYDLLLSGRDGSGNAVTEIYENKGETDGVWRMELYSDELPGIINGESNWVDFDNDGDLDIFLCGEGAGLTPLYRNDDGSFIPVGTALSAFTNAASDWADYDLDGDPDLAICGIRSDEIRTYIFRNDGYNSDTSWLFEQIDPGLIGVSSGDLAWGDYDNDGDPDLILSGNDGAFSSTTRLYENSAGSLMNTNIPFPGLGRGSVDWGDYDHDGDLDLLLTGYSPALESKLTQIYRNDSPVKNDPPSPPVNLSALYQEDHVLFSWDPSNDTESPSDALSYNLRIGTITEGNDVYSSMAHGSGIRKLQEIGNAGQSTTYSIYGLSDGTYYWSVQAIDQGFAGSTFAEESTITLTGIDQFGTEKAFMVYPNPAEEFIILRNINTLYVDDCILTIYSITGKRCKEETVYIVDGQEPVIRIDDLPGGLYLISLAGNGIIYKAKFIKLK